MRRAPGLTRRLLSAVALVFLAPHVSVAQAPPVLTLTQAVNEALLKNDRLVNQRDMIAQTDLGLEAAQNVFRPKVVPNVLGSFGQTDVNSQTYRVDVTQKFVTGTEVRFGTGAVTSQIPGVGGDVRFYNADTTLTLTQPLLRGFGPTVTRRPLTSAELRRAEAGRQQRLAEQQVAIEVVAAYYRVVSQQTFVEIATQSLDRSRKLREASEARLDAGVVSQLDVLRAQQLVAEAEGQLFDAQTAVEDARDQLSFLMGRMTDDTFAVQSAIPRPDTTPIDVTVATALARSSRLELRTSEAGRADADRQVRAVHNALLPQVDVNFALTRRLTSASLSNSFGLDHYQFATFFTIAMPVDRTALRIDYQSAVITRDREARALTTLDRQISDEVRRAVRERERLLRAVTTAETSAAISQKEVEIAQLRYTVGLSNNLDVVSAEGSLLAAEGRRVQALADAAVARLRLLAAMGTFNPRTDVEGTAMPAGSAR